VPLLHATCHGYGAQLLQVGLGTFNEPKEMVHFTDQRTDSDLHFLWYRLYAYTFFFPSQAESVTRIAV